MSIPHDTEELVRQLCHVPLFQGLAADVLTRIRGQAHSKALGASELFFNEGDTAEAGVFGDLTYPIDYRAVRNSRCGQHHRQYRRHQNRHMSAQAARPRRRRCTDPP